MSNRDANHTKQLPTKEIFAPAFGTDAMFVTYASWSGILVDTDVDAAYIKFLIPHDFNELVSLEVVMIPYAVFASMSYRVSACWAFPNTSDLTNQENNWHSEENTVTHELRESDITRCVDAHPLEANQYLGIMISRQVGNNTNTLILGAKLRYK